MNKYENDFETLRRLLALKRHEIPPPGYFENFSGQVVARIRAGERGASEGMVLEMPWLLRLLSAFEAKPAFTGAFAFALCLLLVFGIVVADRPDAVTRPPLTPTAQADMGGILLASSSPSDFSPQPSVQPALISVSSTEPVFNARPASMLFGQSPATVQPLTFPLPGN